MNNIRVKILGIVLLCLVGIFAIPSIVNAGTFSASISKKEVNVGDTFTVTVTASNAAGTYTVTSVDSSIASVVKKGGDWLENGSETWTFKANKAGNVAITAKALDMAGLDDEKAITTSKSFTVKVNEKTASSNNSNSNNNNTSTKKSSDTSLKSVTVGGKSYTIGKSITVDANTSSITIKATANSYNNNCNKYYHILL